MRKAPQKPKRDTKGQKRSRVAADICAVNFFHLVQALQQP
jgi:hypothetical protein